MWTRKFETIVRKIIGDGSFVGISTGHVIAIKQTYRENANIVILSFHFTTFYTQTYAADCYLLLTKQESQWNEISHKTTRISLNINLFLRVTSRFLKLKQ